MGEPPGAAGAEVQTRTRCDESGSRCDVRVGWAHPDRLNPKKVSVALDGRRVAATRSRDVSLDVAGTRGALLTVDMTFPDGRRATHAAVLGGRVHGDEDTVVSAILATDACGPDGPAAAAARRRAAGESVRAVERGEAELVFVAEPAAYGALVRLVGSPYTVPKGADMTALDAILRRADFAVHVVVPDRRLALGELLPKEPMLPALLEALDAAPLRPLRLADAVASAALHVGVPGTRRLVVLVAAEGAEDSSVLGAAAVREYLEEIHVPLVVWRVRPRREAPVAAGPDDRDRRGPPRGAHRREGPARLPGRRVDGAAVTSSAERDARGRDERADVLGRRRRQDAVAEVHDVAERPRGSARREDGRGHAFLRSEEDVRDRRCPAAPFPSHGLSPGREAASSPRTRRRPGARRSTRRGARSQTRS